jgi:hypothetical protein
MKIADPLACGDDDHPELTALLHDPRERRVAADAVGLIQDDGKAEAISLTPPKHIFIDLAQDERPCCDLKLFKWMPVQVNHQSMFASGQKIDIACSGILIEELKVKNWLTANQDIADTSTLFVLADLPLQIRKAWDCCMRIALKSSFKIAVAHRIVDHAALDIA